ncbi:MAG: hypothetical protein ACE5Z5_06930 [Candidatus Bathyarchaeia archaeon]
MRQMRFPSIEYPEKLAKRIHEGWQLHLKQRKANADEQQEAEMVRQLIDRGLLIGTEESFDLIIALGAAFEFAACMEGAYTELGPPTELTVKATRSAAEYTKYYLNRLYETFKEEIDEDVWRTVTGESKKQTMKKIEKAVGMTQRCARDPSNFNVINEANREVQKLYQLFRGAYTIPWLK